MRLQVSRGDFAFRWAFVVGPPEKQTLLADLHLSNVIQDIHFQCAPFIANPSIVWPNEIFLFLIRQLVVIAGIAHFLIVWESVIYS